MVVDEGGHEVTDFLSVRSNLLALLMGQNHILNLLHFGGGAFVSETIEVGVDIVSSEDVNRSAVEMDEPMGMGETTLSSRACDGNKSGEANAHDG